MLSSNQQLLRLLEPTRPNGLNSIGIQNSHWVDGGNFLRMQVWRSRHGRKDLVEEGCQLARPKR